jgi:hypothetical protein
MSSAGAQQERRGSTRYPVSWTILAQELWSPSLPNPKPATIRGQARDVSSGGLCLQFDQFCEVSTLLKCEVFFPGSPAPVPTLAHVRWIRESEQENFVAGVQFLLQ